MRVIDASPTWTGIMPVLIHLIEQAAKAPTDGNLASAETAKAELMRIAGDVDKLNAALKADAAQTKLDI